MHDGFWVAIVIVLGVGVYVIARVVQYARRSREQWNAVDRSKLREWEDDEWEDDEW